MKITTTLAVAFACATLAACGGETNTAENADANMMMTDNLGATDMNMDMNMPINAADGMNSTENAMVNDLTTNTPDTNLANGL